MSQYYSQPYISHSNHNSNIKSFSQVQKPSKAIPTDDSTYIAKKDQLPSKKQTQQPKYAKRPSFKPQYNYAPQIKQFLSEDTDDMLDSSLKDEEEAEHESESNIMGSQKDAQDYTHYVNLNEFPIVTFVDNGEINQRIPVEVIIQVSKTQEEIFENDKLDRFQQRLNTLENNSNLLRMMDNEYYAASKQSKGASLINNIEAKCKSSSIGSSLISSVRDNNQKLVQQLEQQERIVVDTCRNYYQAVVTQTRDFIMEPERIHSTSNQTKNYEMFDFNNKQPPMSYKLHTDSQKQLQKDYKDEEMMSSDGNSSLHFQEMEIKDIYKNEKDLIEGNLIGGENSPIPTKALNFDEGSQSFYSIDENLNMIKVEMSKSLKDNNSHRTSSYKSLDQVKVNTFGSDERKDYRLIQGKEKQSLKNLAKQNSNISNSDNQNQLKIFQQKIFEDKEEDEEDMMLEEKIKELIRQKFLQQQQKEMSSEDTHSPKVNEIKSLKESREGQESKKSLKSIHEQKEQVKIQPQIKTNTVLNKYNSSKEVQQNAQKFQEMQDIKVYQSNLLSDQVSMQSSKLIPVEKKDEEIKQPAQKLSELKQFINEESKDFDRSDEMMLIQINDNLKKIPQIQYEQTQEITIKKGIRPAPSQAQPNQYYKEQPQKKKESFQTLEFETRENDQVNRILPKQRMTEDVLLSDREFIINQRSKVQPSYSAQQSEKQNITQYNDIMSPKTSKTQVNNINLVQQNSPILSIDIEPNFSSNKRSAKQISHFQEQVAQDSNFLQPQRRKSNFMKKNDHKYAESQQDGSQGGEESFIVSDNKKNKRKQLFKSNENSPQREGQSLQYKNQDSQQLLSHDDNYTAKTLPNQPKGQPDYELYDEIYKTLVETKEGSKHFKEQVKEFLVTPLKIYHLVFWGKNGEKEEKKVKREDIVLPKVSKQQKAKRSENGVSRISSQSEISRKTVVAAKQEEHIIFQSICYVYQKQDFKKFSQICIAVTQNFFFIYSAFDSLMIKTAMPLVSIHRSNIGKVQKQSDEEEDKKKSGYICGAYKKMMRHRVSLDFKQELDLTKEASKPEINAIQERCVSGFLLENLNANKDEKLFKQDKMKDLVIVLSSDAEIRNFIEIMKL